MAQSGDIEVNVSCGCIVTFKGPLHLSSARTYCEKHTLPTEAAMRERIYRAAKAKMVAMKRTWSNSLSAAP